MTENERDTHFQGFARLLWEEMLSQTEGYWIDVTAGHIPLHHPEDEEHKCYIDIIAQRAYDLMEHIMLYAPAAPVPDLTQWPDPPNSE